MEVRVLNSKQLDLGIKSPANMRELEPEIRNQVIRLLERGKVDLFITVELPEGARAYTINRTAAVKYQEELKTLLQEFGEECPEGLLPLVLRMPDVVQAGKEEISETEAEAIHKAVEEALNLVRIFRTNEGVILDKDMRGRIALILDYLESVAEFEPARIETIRGNLRKNFEKYAGNGSGVVPDANRFEQEMIYYLEKIDFTEEKVRLKKHCDHFIEVMDHETAQGKKLGFITQEIGREINTLGSKANDAGIQRLVVQMKDELEKIKEQLGNIL